MAMKPVAFLHLLNDFFTLVDALVDRLLVGDTVLPAYLIFFVLHIKLVGLVDNVLSAHVHQIRLQSYDF